MKFKIINLLKWLILLPAIIICVYTYNKVSQYIIEEFSKRLEIISKTNSIFTTTGSTVIFENFQLLIIYFISGFFKPFLGVFIGGLIAPSHKKIVKIVLFVTYILLSICLISYMIFISSELNIQNIYSEMTLFTKLKYLSDLMGVIVGLIVSYIYIIDNE